MACSICDIFKSCHRELSKDPSLLKPYCIEKCRKYRDKRSNAKAEERGKSIVFEGGGNEVICYRVDGGIIAGQSNCKCDNLLLFVDDRQAVFIELKGVDIRHALEQIETAVSILGKDLTGYDFHGRIVAVSGIPDIKNDSKYKNLWKLLKRHNINATLRIRENKQREKALDLKKR